MKLKTALICVFILIFHHLYPFELVGEIIDDHGAKQMVRAELGETLIHKINPSGTDIYYSGNSVIIQSDVSLKSLQSAIGKEAKVRQIWRNYYSADFEADSINQFETKFNTLEVQVRNSGLGMVIKNAIGSIDQVNDPEYGDQWGLDNTGQPGEMYQMQGPPGIPPPPIWFNTWDIPTTEFGEIGVDIDYEAAMAIHDDAEGIIVAVLDTGVDLDHPDLNGRLWTNLSEIDSNGLDDDGNGYADDVNGWRTVSGADDDNVQDDHNHGTFISTIIAANADNSIGMAGIADGCQIMPVKVASSNGSVAHDDWVAGLGYAIDNGAHIVNASFSIFWDAPDDFYEDILAAARDAGILFVTGPGNSQDDLDTENASGENTYPGCVSLLDYPNIGDWDNMICVAAIDRTGTLAYYRPDETVQSGSGFGRNTVHIAAPGAYITGGNRTGGYQQGQGTSYAIPHVVGALAQLMNRFPNDTPEEIRYRLLSSKEYSPELYPLIMGSGFLDLKRAYSIFSSHPTLETTSTRIIPWLGAVNDIDYPECNHMLLQDFRVSPGSIDESGFSMFFPWMMGGVWCWTSDTQFPNFYRFADATWIWFDENSGVPPSFERLFYNFTTQNWEQY